LNKEKEIKQHYLTKTKTGYFFKYGSKQNEYQFLNAISSIFGLSIDDIKKRMIKILSDDTNEQVFTSLNNGDIKTQFKSISAYIDYIKNSNFLDYDIIQSLLSIPKVITTNGINIIVFNKKIHIVKKLLEKETSKEDFYLNCQDYENIINITDPKRETIFLLKENKNYYPIIMVKKEDEGKKSIDEEDEESVYLEEDSEENSMVSEEDDEFEEEEEKVDLGYEVDEERILQVSKVLPAAKSGSGLDLRLGLKDVLNQKVKSVEIVGDCTYESLNLFSHRRDGVTGRQAGFVVLL
jgi:hypothetical protein